VWEKTCPKVYLNKYVLLYLLLATASYGFLVLNVCMHGSNSEAASHVQLCAALAGISS